MPKAKARLRRSAQMVRDSLNACLGVQKPLRINFLHIGKNGGTALASSLKSLNEAQQRATFVIRPHKFKLADVPEDEFAMFVVRDPADRFRSGFYSRQRQGLPRKLSPWNEDERRAFEAFPHANDLAEALSAPCPERRMRAIWAMNSIYHVNNMHLDWMPRAWEAGRGKIVSVLRQEQMQEDLAELLAALDVEMPSLPKDAKGANRGTYQDVPPLSETALANLKQWYHRDYMFLDIVREAWTQEASVRARSILLERQSSAQLHHRPERGRTDRNGHPDSHPG